MIVRQLHSLRFRMSLVVSARNPGILTLEAFSGSAGIDRHAGVSSKGWRIRWETVLPG